MKSGAIGGVEGLAGEYREKNAVGGSTGSCSLQRVMICQCKVSGDLLDSYATLVEMNGRLHRASTGGIPFPCP